MASGLYQTPPRGDHGAASPCSGPTGRPAQDRTPRPPHPRTECRDLHGLPTDANAGAPRLLRRAVSHSVAAVET